ncbi:hypothetical protein ACXYL9_10295 [Qipengyuania sp. CAU 1752]
MRTSKFVIASAAMAMPLGVHAQDQALAQTAPPVAAPAPIASAPTTNAVLRAGTPITLRFLEEVTTKKKRARVGQRVKMEVASPVEVNGVVVIPAGSPAEGEITSVRNKGMWGKSGHLEARALYARVNGRQIRLTGTFDDKGVTGTGGVVASIALVPLAGFFVTGTSAVLPKGGEVGAFVDEDVQLAIAASKPAPLQVQANQPPMTVAPEVDAESEGDSE